MNLSNFDLEIILLIFANDIVYSVPSYRCELNIFQEITVGCGLRMVEYILRITLETL